MPSGKQKPKSRSGARAAASGQSAPEPVAARPKRSWTYGKGPIFPGRTKPTLTTALSGADFAAGHGDSSLKYADDYLFMPLQGATQWDALSHSWYGDTLYNGVPESAVASAGVGGATRLGIENVKGSMVGRGVLVDIDGVDTTFEVAVLAQTADLDLCRAFSPVYEFARRRH